MYTINPSSKFIRKAKKLIKNNALLDERISVIFQVIERDPLYPTLKTHKVKDINENTVYSSRLSHDLRIIWEFNNGQALILDLLDIGGHSGGNKVYS